MDNNHSKKVLIDINDSDIVDKSVNVIDRNVPANNEYVETEQPEKGHENSDQNAKGDFYSYLENFMQTYDSESDETFVADKDEFEDDDYLNEIYDSDSDLNKIECIKLDEDEDEQINCDDIIESDSDLDSDEYDFEIEKEFLTINSKDLTDDNDNFLLKTQILLNKIRSLIKTIKNSNLIMCYLIEKLKENSAKLPALALDFFIRWNSSYIMLKILKKHRYYISQIANESANIKGLDQKKILKLESLNISSTEWTVLAALEYVLTPFYNATLSLSGSKYETIAMSHIVVSCLKSFLSNLLIDESEIQNAIQTVSLSINTNAYNNVEFAACCNKFKKTLLEKFNLYFDTKMSNDQKEKALVKITYYEA